MSDRQRARPWFAHGVTPAQRFVWAKADYRLCPHGVVVHPSARWRGEGCFDCWFELPRLQVRNPYPLEATRALIAEV